MSSARTSFGPSTSFSVDKSRRLTVRCSFHAVYWPALLMAADLPLPKAVLSHGHWMIQSEKMSKSRGNVVDPFQAIESRGVDAVRFYLMRAPGQLWVDACESGLQSDLVSHADDVFGAAWSAERIDEHYRKDLAGQIGNLLMRISSRKLWDRMPSGYRDGRGLFIQPDEFNDWPAQDRDIRVLIQSLPSRQGPSGAAARGLTPFSAERYEALMSEFEIPRAVAAVCDVVAEVRPLFSRPSLVPETLSLQVNRHLQAASPWRPECDPARRHRTLFLAAEALRFAGILLQPIIPAKASQLLDALGVPQNGRGWTQLSTNRGAERGSGVKEHIGRNGNPVLFPMLKETVVRAAGQTE